MSFAAEIETDFRAPPLGEAGHGLDRIIVSRDSRLPGDVPTFGVEEDLFAGLEFCVVEITAAVVFALSGDESGRGAPAVFRVPIVLPDQAGFLLDGLAPRIRKRTSVRRAQFIVIVSAFRDFVARAEFGFVAV